MQKRTQEKAGKLLLIIPAHNEAENLPGVLENILAQAEPPDFLVVSDGSSDGTVEFCRTHGCAYLELPVNLGLAGCFQAGMKYAFRKGYDYAVQFDGDGQHRAEDIPSLQRVMEKEKSDLVLGSRFLKRKKGGSMRELGSRLLSAAIWLTTGKHITDPTCGLRLYNRRMMESFANRMNYGPEPDTISYLIRNGARVSEAEVQIRERAAGESYLRPVNAMWYMLRMLVSILLVQSFRSRG